ncbi:MAG TPA: maleylpyruvate isomerase family mycothiol-dependent enzyme [Gemmatimonadales bacterium]|nr:maleylpyruvate isomerase family mycothiol-dependent enzyme [Gemmatimonadales bacterium]
MTTTAQLRSLEPVLVLDRFAPLHAELIGLLRSLSPDDWNRPTACALWSVRDIAAHLLDDDLRRLSFHRDRQPPPGGPPASNADLVAMVNRLNAEWVAVARRMSTRVIVDLLEVTGPWVVELFRATDPFAPAFWGVTWAGEPASPHWFDVGRDYTERWLHQQQIRDAVGAAPLTGREWLHPVLDLFVRALPFAYRDTGAQPGTTVVVSIEGGAGGEWTLRREEQRWALYAGAVPGPAATVTMTDDAAWRLFAKQLKGDAARGRVTVAGDQALGDVARTALAVLA